MRRVGAVFLTAPMGVHASKSRRLLDVLLVPETPATSVVVDVVGVPDAFAPFVDVPVAFAVSA
jgi:hypothetical protein